MCGLIIDRLKELPHYDEPVVNDSINIFIFIERGLCTYIWETTIESIINSFSIINQGSNDSEDENSTPLSTIDPYVYFLLYI